MKERAALKRFSELTLVFWYQGSCDLVCTVAVKQETPMRVALQPIQQPRRNGQIAPTVT
jgi:hypothetical protein